MKKNESRLLIVAAVILVLYHLVIFVAPFYRGGTFWASYGFTLASFVVGAASGWIGFVKQPNAKSKFYGFPVLRIGCLYTLFQLGISLIVMLLGSWIPAWIAVLVYAVALGAAVIGLVSADTMVEQITIQDQNLNENIALMRNLQSKVLQLTGYCRQEELQGIIRKLAEEFRYSDPVSCDALGEIENDLAAEVDNLQEVVTEGDWNAARQLSAQVSALLAERNRQCKLNKQN